MSELIIGATEGDLASLARKPITEMSPPEMMRELSVLRDQNDKLGQVLAAAAPHVAAIEQERDQFRTDRDGLRAEVDRLHERLQKRRENLARDAGAGEHWYELTAAFDPNQIRMLPLPDGKRAFLMGVLDDLVIVEVPKDTSTDTARAFQEFLRRQGLKSAAIVVTDGVQFMRIRRVEDKQARALDAKLAEGEAAENTDAE